MENKRRLNLDILAKLGTIGTKKYAVVLTVMDTEDIKLRHAVDILASDGMFKHLMSMVVIQLQLRNLMLVWKTTISAEIQMVVIIFGVTQQMVQDMNIVTQLSSKLVQSG